MRSRFHPLLRLRLRHGFYHDGRSTSDFVLRAEATTARRLAEQGFLLRLEDDGTHLIAEIEAGQTRGSTPTLLRPQLGAGQHFIFLLEPRHLHLETITDLPRFRPSREVFVFDNLRLDPESGEGRLFLGDSAAGTRLGPPIRFETSTLDFAFSGPVESSSLRIRDRFGGLVFEQEIEARPPGISEARIDLRGAGLAAGRYRIEAAGEPSLDFFFLPQGFDTRPFAAVELWSRTDDVTPDGSDRVPAEHRFLDGEEITNPGDFVVAFESRKIRWQYEVIKKYRNNGIALRDLSVVSDAGAFEKTVGNDRAIFISPQDLALQERPVPPILERNGDELMTLPSPRAHTPLESGPGDSYLSRLFVYV